MNESGHLYLCATPIGNLEDITLRVLKVLKEVDFIAAEDTRHTLKLLNHFEISKPLISYHEHNKDEKGKQIILELKKGKSVALVSDAGTPGISDPGEDLVKLCIEHNITVTSLPGPVAAISALILSGLPTTRFSFEGFLPVAGKSRREQLEQIKNDTRTLIFYEAPHKLNNTLKDLLQTLGNRKITIAREMTKKFEQVIRCSLEEAVQRFDKETPRGEFVLVVEGADPEELKARKHQQWEELSIQQHIDLYIAQGLNHKEALKKVAKDRGVGKREIYAIQLQERR